ncbi:MAG TPA: C40 family peptidase [Rhizomicrobium sp.]|jgi:cell wall-associated NlpC family hydrolase|nr:C40 family peptidase [Rhizomicrobium sp.]
MADKRLTPARPDLASSSLKGRVEAAHFVDGEEATVAWGRVSLRAGPSHDSRQVSELLFGEIVTIYERKDGWAWLQAKTDSYVGYARESGLGPAFAADAHVIQLLTPLLSAPDVKSPLRDLLPLNARVKRGRQEGNFVAVADGFVSAQALAPAAASDFVAVAERFIGVPYVWGGKTFQGLDCSGLIQTALQAAGIACPRDTDMMEQALGHAVTRDQMKRGDLIFWKGHMGVMRDAQTLLHANAFHMQVSSEPLDAAIARIATPVTAIKRL